MSELLDIFSRFRNILAELVVKDDGDVVGMTLNVYDGPETPLMVVVPLPPELDAVTNPNVGTPPETDVTPII
jgi:hypothetical protein